MKIKERAARGDWNSVIQYCEDGLALNPWDRELNLDLGLALQAVGIEDAAVWCFHRAAKME